MRARLLLALGLLVIGGSVCWAIQIDDQFISLAYARSLAESGLLLWSNHGRVEGYSNFLWVVLQTVLLGLRLDPDLGGKMVAIGSGFGILAYLERQAPAGFRGTLALLAVAAWVPLGWWSFTGMETSLYALLLTVGWGELSRGRSGVGLGLLWLAAVTRPEGPAQWLAGMVLFWRGTLLHPRDRRNSMLLVLAMGLYQTFRIAWFGEVLPTPFLVKVQESPWEFDTPWQAMQELGSLVGVALALLLAGKPKAGIFAPLLIQMGLELSADTDWMGHGRLLLPGVTATAALWLGSCRYRPLRPWVGAVAMGVVGFGALLDPPGIGVENLKFRDIDPLLHVYSMLTLPLDTPAVEDVVWVVRHVPDGSTLLTGDVGMVGTVPGVTVLDLNGLTDRRIALANLGQLELEPLPDAFPRILRQLGDDPPAPWMGRGYRLLQTWKVEPFKVRWFGAGNLAELSRETIQRRWETLIERHPRQGALRRAAAEDRAADGDLEGALRILGDYVRRWPDEPKGRSLRTSVSFPDRKAGSWLSPVLLHPEGFRLGVKVPEGTEVLVRSRWECQQDYSRQKVNGEARMELPPPCPVPGRLGVWVGGGTPVTAEVWLESAEAP